LALGGRSARLALAAVIPAARLAWRRLGPTRARLASGAHALLVRVTRDLPERPDGKTIAAALAAIVVVCGLSASVLGSRRVARPLASPETPSVALPAAEAPPPEAAPVPDVARAEPVREVRPAARHHRAKHRARRGAAPISAPPLRAR
jgi:hypothetical protein